MTGNYIKTAIRNLMKRRFYSVLNIAGLSIAVACLVLVGLYVRFQLSFDDFHDKGDRIYRVGAHYMIRDNDDQFALSPIPIGLALQTEFPEVQMFTRFKGVPNAKLTHEDGREFIEENFLYADSTFFRVLTYEKVSGDLANSLTEPGSMVITRSTEKRYFGDESGLGKQMTGGSGTVYTVTGVIEDVPQNTHVPFDGLLSRSTAGQRFGTQLEDIDNAQNFWFSDLFTYILLTPGSDIADLEAKIDHFYDKYMKSIGDQIGSSFEPIFENIGDIHLHSDLGYDYPTGDVRYVWIFSAVGLLLLAIACINYTILSTSLALSRSNEVGMRKVVGATRSMLIGQFLAESTIVALISVVLGIVLAALFMPFFNQLTNLSLSLTPVFMPESLLLLLGLVILVGFGSGIYPAFYLSSFDPQDVLSGRQTSGRRAGVIRTALVVVQFAIACFLIISTLIVSDQLNFMRTKDLGFNDDNIVAFAMKDSASFANKDYFIDEMGRNPDIAGFTRFSNIPVGNTGRLVHYVDLGEGFVEKPVNYAIAWYNYIDFMEMKLLAGQGWDSTSSGAVDRRCIVNRALAEDFGWGVDSAIGKIIRRGQPDNPGFVEMEVGGVVENFNYNSLHNPVEPILFINFERVPVFLVRYREGKRNAVVTFLEERWDNTNSIFPFDPVFLNETIDEMYIPEKRTASAFGVLSLISLFVAVLGLFGLASHTINRRRREIAIRKVLGATPMSIAMMFGREFAVRVLIANVIAWPFAWYAMTRWLENFAFRVSPGISSFLIALVASTLVAKATVMIQSTGSARMSPKSALE